MDFNAILEGKDQPKKKEPEKKVAEHTVKVTATDTRQRQQSCKVTDLDKDLVPSPVSLAAEERNLKQESGRLQSVSLRHAQHRTVDFTQDTQDESLQNYKKALLGNIKEEELKEDEGNVLIDSAAEVEILRIEVVCKGRPGGNIVLDFRGKDVGKQRHAFKIKEGSIYNLRVYFMVRYDIVYGLKFVNNVYKTFLKGNSVAYSVEKDEEKMGSFAPKK